ncbi:MAG: hypothetical protein EA358_07490 [Flavobacteriales bacterium]|nr:MAG: hypothetical protein EA358_07490 [Flavobacteriales bacterium]
MEHLYRKFFICFFILSIPLFSNAQVDTTDTDDDWELYAQFEVADEPTRLWADAKIIGLSPQRFFSLGYDYHMGYPMTMNRGEAGELETNTAFTQGLRFTSNIPIISRTSFIWQSGLNFSDFRYNIDDVGPGGPITPPVLSRPEEVVRALDENGVRVASWINTFYKPLSGNSFILIQAQLDYAGDYTLSNMQSLDYVRYSGAVLWGRRPSDYKQWAIGASRTYRVGAMNYIPIVLYNWTSRSKTWGAEILAPARAHGRYNFNARNLLLFGYELDGASHRLNQVSNDFGSNSIELRRGEIKLRLDYQFQVTGFFWASIQAGYRINYSFHIDEIEGRHDYTRLFGLGVDRDFWMPNGIGNTPYFHVSLNFVSP